MSSNQIQTVQDKGASVVAFLQSRGSEIAKALPPHFTGDRFLRLAINNLMANKDLLECDKLSLYGAILESARLGLEPGGVLGQAHLVPFWDSKTRTRRVTFLVGYKGLMELARRSGEISMIFADVVRKGDDFVFERGLSPTLVHRPDLNGTGEEDVLAVYAVAKLKDGSSHFEVMTRAQVEKIRAGAKAGNGGPWCSHWEEMAKKTAIRRLCKYLPVSTEDLKRAVALDELAEAGVAQPQPVVDFGPRVVPSDLDAISARIESMNAPTTIDADGVVVEESAPPVEVETREESQSSRTADSLFPGEESEGWTDPDDVPSPRGRGRK